MLDGQMTQTRFESSIDAVIAELNLGLRVFAVDHIQRKAGVWTAVLTGPGGLETEVSIDTHIHNTASLVLDAIRSQLLEFKEKLDPECE